MKLEISINTNTEICIDEPRYGEWEIDVSGVFDTDKPFDAEVERLVEDGSASLIDQDGGELRTVSPEEASNAVYRFAREAVIREVLDAAREKLDAFVKQDVMLSIELPEMLALQRLIKDHTPKVEQGEIEEHA